MSQKIERRDEPFKAHHVFGHAVAGELYYRDDLDCAHFLTFLSEEVVKTDVTCLAYSLVGNHFHLILVSGARWGISRFMKRLLSRYARYYNRRYRRIGHLRRRPFGSEPIDSDAQLVTAIRYVILNRVMAGLVPDLDALETDPWTSYGIAMRGRPVNVVEEARILSIFGAVAEEARQTLRRFCQAGLEKRDWFAEMTKILEATHRYKLERASVRRFLPGFEDPMQEIERLARVVASHAGIPLETTLGGRARNRAVARVRGAVAHLARRLFAAKGRMIGAFFRISESAALKLFARGEADALAMSLEVENVAAVLTAQSPAELSPNEPAA